ncbi:MAG: DUF1194 domain-containing protein [Pseudomonadota bacterium]
MISLARLAAALALAYSLALPGLAAADEPVDLELVLAIDASTSVDTDEFNLQRAGLAAAFRHPDVIGAIHAAGERGVAITLLQWSGRGRQRVSVDWTLIRDAASASRLADRIDVAPRLVTGLTDIAGAVRYSLSLLQDNGFRGYRQVIDVSGDGSGDAPSAELARNAAIARGVTVNGLVIYNEDIDLGALAKLDIRNHYADHVIGGPGAFLMTADDFVDFQVAIRRKLVREIMGPATAQLRSSVGHAESHLLKWETVP